MTKSKTNAKLAKVAAQMRECALAYPETHEDFPWGHSAFKVGKKVFLFMSLEAEGLGLSAKLTASRYEALELPFASPTHYGLGKHGWVSASFAPGDSVPVGLLEQWLDESYRAIAPKKLVKQLDGDVPAPAKKARKKSSSRRGR